MLYHTDHWSHLNFFTLECKALCLCNVPWLTYFFGHSLHFKGLSSASNFFLSHSWLVIFFRSLLECSRWISLMSVLLFSIISQLTNTYLPCTSQTFPFFLLQILILNSGNLPWQNPTQIQKWPKWIGLGWKLEAGGCKFWHKIIIDSEFSKKIIFLILSLF